MKSFQQIFTNAKLNTKRIGSIILFVFQDMTLLVGCSGLKLHFYRQPQRLLYCTYGVLGGLIDSLFIY